MSRPSVLSMVTEYLKANGYDGIFSDGCGCKVGDLFPCGDTYSDCEAGHEIPCDPETCQADGDCVWHIGPEEDGG